MKLKVHDAYKKDEKITTNFEPINSLYVINKAYLDTKLSKLKGQISYIEKVFNEYKLHNKEDSLIERAVRTTIQIFYDKGLFDNYANADQLLKDYSFVEVNDRRRLDLEQSK